ncbi:FHA domain-containing protein [Sulfurivermis fontis]|uniref:FHA domain-containing protein n=1 Tax=Sulfurivermis fontis TaxID=1972068 RepID=UPI000FD9CD48|nr:FHA domain-containing protein [Sulfurivermis fontis]
MAALIQIRNNVEGVKVLLSGDSYSLGRGDGNDIVVNDDLASREHALLERVVVLGKPDEVRYIIRDLGSTNGTFVNHKQVSEQALNDGDVIRLGQTFLRFALHEQGDAAETKVIKKTIIPGVYITTEKK